LLPPQKLVPPIKLKTREKRKEMKNGIDLKIDSNR
jgi:hypothetical protein